MFVNVEDADPDGIPHGFSGIPSLNLVGAQLSTAYCCIPVGHFTATKRLLGTHFFSCSNSLCGTLNQHRFMRGSIVIVP